MLHRINGFVSVLLAALCAPMIAHAEKADREKPIRVEADRVSLDDLNRVSVFEGNVVLTQGTLQVRADRLTVRQDAERAQYASAVGRPPSFARSATVRMSSLRMG